MNDIDLAWTKRMFHAHYERYRQGWTVPNADMIEAIRREKWKRMRKTIGQEVEALIPLTLIPPPGQRELDNETLTIYDVDKTERVQMSHYDD